MTQGPLKNPRHEKFAQALAAGTPASVAYALSGYTPNDGNAIRLKGNDKVQARVVELQVAVAKSVIWDAKERLRTLEWIANQTEESHPRVAIAAIAEANKMQGSYASAKHETDNANTPQAFIQKVMANAQSTPIDKTFNPRQNE